MTLAAVSDAGPLIHLAETDSLEHLSTFDTLLVSETDAKENNELRERLERASIHRF